MGTNHSPSSTTAGAAARRRQLATNPPMQPVASGNLAAATAATAGETAKQLREEEERLNVIKENLKKSAQLRDQIDAVHSSFTKRLAMLGANILPMHDKTAALQRKQQSQFEKAFGSFLDIQRVLKTIDATLQFHNATADMENVIQEGPTRNLPNYLRHLSQMAEAINFFHAQPAHESKIGDLRGTFEFGCKTLEKEYRNAVQAESKMVDPIALVNYLGDKYEIDMTKLRQNPACSTLKDATRIRQISDWLLANTSDRSFLDQYSAIRGENMLKTLQLICNHRMETKRTASLPITPNMSIPGAPGTPILNVTPKSTTGFRQALRKATGRSSDRYTTRKLGPDLMDVDIDVVLVLFAAFLALNELETEILPKAVGGVSEAARVQRTLIGQPLSFVVKTAQVTLYSVNRQPILQAALDTLDGSVSVIACLPLLRLLHTHESQLCALAANATVEIPIAALITELNAACYKWLNDFVDQLSNDDSKYVPPDGNVHQVTANTLSFLHQLLQQRVTVTQLLTSQSQGTASVLLPRLFARILSALGLNLKNKRENYPDEALGAIFMMNNQKHIHKNLMQDGLLAIVCQQNSEVSAFYENEVQQYLENYLRSWNGVLTACTEFPPQDKNAIKAAFAAFNREFELTLDSQRAFCIADVGLAGTVRNRVKSLIGQPYAKFYNNFSRNLFARNLEKYLKYDPDQVQLIIDRLFDASA